MQVAGLWRYPVKSMGGQALDESEVGPGGLRGDRQFGVVRAESGNVLSAKREGRLLLAQARLAPTLEVTLPTGEILGGLGSGVDKALTAWLGYPVRLAAADLDGAPTFETQGDMFDDESPTRTWKGFAGSWADSWPVHLVATGTLDVLALERPDLPWEIERFRPNVLVTAGADELDGDLTIGRAGLHVDKPCARCVMVTRAQPRLDGGPAVERQVEVLRHVNHMHDSNVGVLARVTRAGRIAVGDQVAATAGLDPR